MIQNLAIDEDTVKAELLTIGDERTQVSVKIERIELADIDSGADPGVLLAKVSRSVTQAILTGRLQNAEGLILADVAAELAESLDGIRGLRRDVGASRTGVRRHDPAC